MRITFVGATEFSKHCLEIVRHYVDDIQVLTRANDGTHGDWADLDGVVIEDINDEAERIREFDPDYILVFGWSQIVGEKVRDIAPCIGSHPTLLPRGRGRHALGHILTKGIPFGGLTLFFLDEGVDSGDMLLQKSFRVMEDDDLRSLYEKVKGAASDLLQTLMFLLGEGIDESWGKPQDESRATYWGKLPKEEQIDYSDYFPTS